MRSSVPFEEVTEASGLAVSAEAVSMMLTRYLFAASLGKDRRVLEIACGSGTGLGLLSRSARSVVGGDINVTLLALAAKHYRGRVPLVRLSATFLPFADCSFDLVLLMEASYYLEDFGRALREIARVLSVGGLLCIVSANPDRPDFIRSPHSYHYYSSDEFRVALSREGFEVTTAAAFPLSHRSSGIGQRTFDLLAPIARRILGRLGLVPRTLAGRARLKRLLGSRLLPLPPELTDDFAPIGATSTVPVGPVTGYKVIYVCGRKQPP